MLNKIKVFMIFIMIEDYQTFIISCCLKNCWCFLLSQGCVERIVIVAFYEMTVS